MKKSDLLLDAKIFSYEEFQVAEILQEKNKECSFSGNFKDEELNLYSDIYAPNGIPSIDFDGKTIVEVKKFLSYSTIKDMDVFYQIHGSNYNVLVVYFNTSVSNIPSVKNTKGKKFRYISFKELKGKRKDKNERNYYKNKIEKRDWKQQRKEIIESAKMVVEQGNNVLFLGAGVSASAKMPSWEELLKGLMGEVKQLNESTRCAFKELNTQVFEECGDSFPIMARYLQKAVHLYDDKEIFAELIQKHLYNDNDSSPLITALAQIIKQKKANAVITYNFDDVLERNLDKLNLKDSIDYTSISKDAEIRGHNTLPIYHVHGIIPKEGPVDTVVFSEEEYHERYSNAFHWSNVEQLHSLARMHCFFIGLSMNDPNLRRLLDAAQKMNRTNGERHFAFLKRTKLEKYCVSDVEKVCKYVHVSESLIDNKKQAEIYNLNYAVIESMFLDFGIRVIWFEDFNELPDLIDKVFGIVSYKNKSNEELLEISEKQIEEIKKIEEGVPSINPVSSTSLDFVDFYIYKREKGADYRHLIADVANLLNELSNRISLKNENIDKILEIQKKVPQSYDNLSGYASFYHVWLESIKQLI